MPAAATEHAGRGPGYRYLIGLRPPLIALRKTLRSGHQMPLSQDEELSVLTGASVSSGVGADLGAGRLECHFRSLNATAVHVVPEPQIHCKVHKKVL